MPTFSLNFSRPGSEVIAQYFMLHELGRDGYTTVMRGLQHIATSISAGDRGARALPAHLRRRRAARVRVRPRSGVENYTVFDVSDRLRQHGWLVPAYTFPPEARGPQRAADRRAQRDDAGDGRLLLEHLRQVTVSSSRSTARCPAPESRPTGLRTLKRRGRVLEIGSARARPAARRARGCPPRAPSAGQGSARRSGRARRRPTIAWQGTPAWRARVATSETALPARLWLSSRPSPVTTARAARIRASKPTASSTNGAPGTQLGAEAPPTGRPTGRRRRRSSARPRGSRGSAAGEGVQPRGQPAHLRRRRRPSGARTRGPRPRTASARRRARSGARRPVRRRPGSPRSRRAPPSVVALPPTPR